MQNEHLKRHFCSLRGRHYIKNFSQDVQDFFSSKTSLPIYPNFESIQSCSIKHSSKMRVPQGFFISYLESSQTRLCCRGLHRKTTNQIILQGSRLEPVCVSIQDFCPYSLAGDHLTKTFSISRSSTGDAQILNSNNFEVLKCSLDQWRFMVSECST